MEIIKVYYSDCSKLKNFEFAISGWYCKPAILSSLAFKLNCQFLTCSKYGCRQFTSCWSVNYPVHEFIKYPYKVNLNWVVLEFNEKASVSPWSDIDIRSLYELQRLPVDFCL